MSLMTTVDFLNYSNINIEESNLPISITTSNMLSKENIKNDLEYVKKTKPCIISKSVLGHLDDIRTSNLEELYNEQFFDIGFMKYLTDLTCPIFYPVDGEHNTTFVKTWLKNFKKIGANSAEGIALQGSITDDPNEGLFVIKAPRTQNDDLAHEAVVGYALAPLRSLIPNFSWVYGVLRCSIPLLTDGDKKLSSWCNDVENPVTYVVYEKIPGVNLRTFVKTCTEQEFLCILMQIIFSLIMAERYCGFTHYDLHYENIIVRPLKENADIIYDLGDDTKVVLNTKYIATFIDYGFSRVEFDGRTSGRYGFEGFSIYGDKSYIMFDIFKVLCFSCSVLINGNYKATNIALDLLRFFTNDDVRVFLAELGGKNGLQYSLPYQLGFSYTTKNLIKYIYSKFDISFMRTMEELFAGDNVLNCEYQLCMTNAELDKIIHIDENESFDSIESYYIAMKNGVINILQRQKFREKFKNSLISEFYYNLRPKLKEISAELKTTSVTMVFSNAKIAAVNSKNNSILREFRYYVEHIVDIIGMYNDIVHDYDMLIEVTKNLQLDPKDILESRERFVNSCRRYILEYYESLKLNLKYIKELNMKDKWYKTVLPTYVESINIATM